MTSRLQGHLFLVPTILRKFLVNFTMNVLVSIRKPRGELNLGRLFIVLLNAGTFPRRLETQGGRWEARRAIAIALTLPIRA